MDKTFEEYLEGQHMLGYIGAKDKALESFQLWIQELEPEQWINYGEMYALERSINQVDKLRKSLFPEVKK